MTLAEAPLFSVIMATWGRGRHIAPSIRSVLEQDFADFELIVVGDGCQDETEATVAGFRSEKVRWLNLEARCGSQSAPNNAGIAAARGKVVAYLGHDDIWERHHLSSLAALYAARSDLDFAIGGMIMHLPAGLPGAQVTGMFEGGEAQHRHFFPPSSVSHLRSVTSRIGPWRLSDEVSAPVDMEIFKRAADAGLAFASTGRISVHKFNAAYRYLSYLEPSSEEQDAILTAMQAPDHAAWIDKVVAESKACNAFMNVQFEDYSGFAPGELARRNLIRRGLRSVETVALGLGARIEQVPSHCALDWNDEPVDGIRWSKLNPAPKFLLPFTAEDPARLSLQVYHADPAGLRHLDLSCNGTRIKVARDKLFTNGRLWRATFVCVVTLKPA
ncbi:MAG: glycosyltransferase family A protein, partial [Rhodobacterales bacterium]|nr:glycosyltransferase family A protein [Rhodobacterales bacterium]